MMITGTSRTRRDGGTLSETKYAPLWPRPETAVV